MSTIISVRPVGDMYCATTNEDKNLIVYDNSHDGALNEMISVLEMWTEQEIDNLVPSDIAHDGIDTIYTFD